MLDDLDRGLVHALHIDGRAPFNRIADVLGVSTQTVARRYRRLHAEAGLRVVGLADRDRSGETQWTIRLTATPATAQALAHSLTRRPETSWVKLTSGGTEIFAIAHAPHAAHPLVLRDVSRRGGITAVSAHYMLRTYLGGPTAWRGRLQTLSAEQQRRLREPAAPSGTPEEPHVPPRGVSLPPAPADPSPPPAHLAGAPAHPSPAPAGPPPPPAHPSPPPTDPAAPVVLAPADHALVDALRHDGRAGYGELAAATGWSQATVARRLADLRARGTVFFDVEADDTAFGVTTQALLWMSVAPAHLDRVATALAGHDELAVVVATTGPTNLLAQAMCADPADLHRYLTERLGALEQIRTLETAPVLSTLKAAGHPTAPAGPPGR